MTVRITAVYENGVFRPTGPVALADGQTVDMLVSGLPRLPTPLVDDEYSQRLAAAKTLTELFEVMDSAPDEDDGYDFFEAMNENRRMVGGRIPYPPEMKGITW